MLDQVRCLWAADPGCTLYPPSLLSSSVVRFMILMVTMTSPLTREDPGGTPVAVRTPWPCAHWKGPRRGCWVESRGLGSWLHGPAFWPALGRVAWGALLPL